MSEPQRNSEGKPRATRISDASVTFNKVVPIMLVSLVVVTTLLIVASVLVILGVF